MPEWGDKPDVALKSAMHQVWEGLEEEVSDNPSFDQVTGIPLDKMTEHATEAVAHMLSKKEAEGIDPTVLVQCYAMGFVIGMKFASFTKDHPDAETG